VEDVAVKQLGPPKKNRQSRWPGTSPYAAAKELGIAWPLLRTAIDNGEVKTISFGNRIYLTNAELERVRKMLEEGM
jgi:hypothetical protein